MKILLKSKSENKVGKTNCYTNTKLQKEMRADKNSIKIVNRPIKG